MKFVRGRISEGILANGTKKAFAVVAEGRYWQSPAEMKWVPRSICEIGERYENGYVEITIPLWWFWKNEAKPEGVNGFSVEEIY